MNAVGPLYADRDPSKLEPWYSQHVNAMTAEGLHSKSDIAAELAHRDRELDEAITLLRAVAWCDCEIGALAVGVQQWLERRGIQWANDAGTYEEWRRVVEKQTVEHEVTRLCPGGPER